MVLSEVTGRFVAVDYSNLPHANVVPSLEFSLDVFADGRDYETEYDSDADMTRIYNRENGRIPDGWIRISFDTDGSSQVGSFAFDAGVINLPGEATNIVASPLISPRLKLGADYDYDSREGRIEYLPRGRVVTGDRIRWAYSLPVVGTQETLIQTVEVGVNTVRLAHSPVWSVSLTDTATGESLYDSSSIDYRNGLLQIVVESVSDVELTYTHGDITTYATVLDYLQSHENPEVAQKNATAVWSALERATQRIKAIFHRVGIMPPSAPLPNEFRFLQTIALQLSRVYLKLCRDQEEIDNIMSELSRLEKQLGNGRGRKVRHAKGKRYVSPLPDIVDPTLR